VKEREKERERGRGREKKGRKKASIEKVSEWGRWPMSVIPATGEAELGGSQFKARTGYKKLVRPHFKEQAGSGGACLEISAMWEA
jgi:hypothetical protein